MDLKILNINFESLDSFTSRIELIMDSQVNESPLSISFDQEMDYKKVFTSNRLEILMAVEKFKPQSIQDLAKHINRAYPHVFNDCKFLAQIDLLKLEEKYVPQKTLIPILSYPYDAIKVNSKMGEVYLISDRAKKLIA